MKRFWAQIWVAVALMNRCAGKRAKKAPPKRGCEELTKIYCAGAGVGADGGVVAGAGVAAGARGAGAERSAPGMFVAVRTLSLLYVTTK